MTPAEFREARMLAQLTQEQAGEKCHLQGTHKARTVRRWESGHVSIPLYAEFAILTCSQAALSVPALLRKQAS